MTETMVESSRLLEALAQPSKGKLYDLDPGRFPGMPLWAGHPPFQVITYRTPRGIRMQGDQAWLGPDVNEANIGLLSEMIIATSHSGAHVDALAHITCGPDDHWHGGVTAEEALGDFGPLRGDASTMRPLVGRGVLVDVAGHLGVERLGKSHAISLDEFTGALERQSVEVRSGDIVLVRTGQMSVWPDKAVMAETIGAGITKPIADFCVDAAVVGVGADTEACEVMPSVVPGNPHPVHQRLLIEAGIHILENVYLEDLARDREYTFLFVALPPKITGATGGMVRPIAIV